jgi:hypothetical protein
VVTVKNANFLVPQPVLRREFRARLAVVAAEHGPFQLDGVEFVTRYLRHVLPKGLRAIRQYGFCHPAAKAKREKIAFLTGRPLLVGALELPPPKPERPPKVCACCGGPLLFMRKIEARWERARRIKLARARSPPAPQALQPAR